MSCCFKTPTWLDKSDEKFTCDLETCVILWGKKRRTTPWTSCAHGYCKYSYTVKTEVWPRGRFSQSPAIYTAFARGGGTKDGETCFSPQVLPFWEGVLSGNNCWSYAWYSDNRLCRVTGTLFMDPISSIPLRIKYAWELYCKEIKNYNIMKLDTNG
jgi:hypothetical protein